MAKLIRCPNCGAPFEKRLESGATCPYCGSHVLFEGRSARPTASAASAGPLALVVVAIGGLIVVSSAVAIWSGASRGGRAVPPRRASINRPPEPPPVPLSRLAKLDLKLSLDAAKRVMPREFPEATTDAHHKEYTLRIAHPVLSSARIFWDWGCDCFGGTVFSYTDYETWRRAQARFASCLIGKLGPPTSSNPPFDYDWPAREGRPSLHAGPQTLSLGYDQQTTLHGYQHALEVLDACR